jgi:putative spermidine/putrescine transport system permease protein
MPRAETPDVTRLSWGLRLWVIVVAILLLAPTFVVLPMSFSTSEVFQFPPKHWSVVWYRTFFSSQAWRSAVVASIEIGILVAILATVLGVAASLGLARAKYRGRGALRMLMMAPMIMPGIVVAVAIYSVFLKWHLTGTVLGFVLAHTTLALPFVIVSVSSSLLGQDRTLELAASSLGASPVATFRRVTLPLILPGVLTGFAFAFVTSLDEVVIALFLQTPNLRTLPALMYTSMTQVIDPTTAAASSFMVVVTTVVLLVLQFARGRRSGS